MYIYSRDLLLFQVIKYVCMYSRDLLLFQVIEYVCIPGISCCFRL